MMALAEQAEAKRAERQRQAKEAKKANYLLVNKLKKAGQNDPQDLSSDN